MEAIKTLKEHCEFNSDYDCYILYAIARKKDIPEITNSQEVVFREIIKDTNDIEKKYHQLKEKILGFREESGRDIPFYLYVSLNARDSFKSSLLLVKKMLTWIEEEHSGVNHSREFKRILKYVYSTLSEPSTRTKSQKYFMIDYDSKGNLDEFMHWFMKPKNIEVKLLVETKNGYHIKVKPFDRRIFQDMPKDIYPVEVKVDGLLFLEYMNKKEK